MENTMLIQVTNQKAIKLIQELEALDLIKVLNVNFSPPKKKLSEKYRGALSIEEGEKLNEHIKQMRNEWNRI